MKYMGFFFFTELLAEFWPLDAETSRDVTWAYLGAERLAI